MFQEKYGAGSGACLGLPAPRRSELGEFSEVRGGDAEVVGGVGEAGVLLMVTTSLQNSYRSSSEEIIKEPDEKKEEQRLPLAQCNEKIFPVMNSHGT